MVVLRNRQIRDRLKILAQLSVLSVLYKSYHLIGSGYRVQTPDAKLHPYGIGALCELLCEGLVHYGHFRRVGRVMFVEIAPVEHPCLQRLEEARAYLIDRRLRCLALPLSRFSPKDVLIDPVATQRNDRRDRSRVYSWNRPHSL